MRKLRHLKGNDGEGLREFSELVTRIIESNSSGTTAAGG